MKTSYELAMERLSKGAPAAKLTDKQRKQLGELDQKYAAKIAERELALNAEAEQAAGKGDFEGMEKLREQLVVERKALNAELEEKKDAVRQGKG